MCTPPRGRHGQHMVRTGALSFGGTAVGLGVCSMGDACVVLLGLGCCPPRVGAVFWRAVCGRGPLGCSQSFVSAHLVVTLESFCCHTILVSCAWWSARCTSMRIGAVRRWGRNVQLLLAPIFPVHKLAGVGASAHVCDVCGRTCWPGCYRTHSRLRCACVLFEAPWLYLSTVWPAPHRVTSIRALGIAVCPRLAQSPLSILRLHPVRLWVLCLSATALPSRGAERECT